MKYLDDAQLQRYKLTDPCTVTCNTGYTGEFCQDQTSFFTALPIGPWNQAGYYTSGSGLLRTQSINVDSIDYIQYTKQDSVLIGILDAVYASSRVVEIALYSRTIRTVLTPPVGGSFDSLVVRSGVVYLARTRQISLSLTSSEDVYDAVALSSTYAMTPLITTSARIGLLEVFIDKGTITTFVYLPTSKAIKACYPDGTCPTWATVNDANGLACGSDCHSAVYASAGSKIFRVSSAEGAVLLKNTASAIYCLTGISALNTLLYKSATTINQHSLTSQSSNSIQLGVNDAGMKKACSLDVAELNNQILIVQDGVIRTLESVQYICGYGLTSRALLANTAAACVPCPLPPENAFWIEGSAVCEWACKAEFTKTGSRCVAQVVVPCPAYHVSDPLNPVLCVPSRLPWVRQGGYVQSVQFSQQLTLPGRNSYQVTAVSASVLIEVSMGIFSMSRDSGVTWESLSLNSFTDNMCPVSDMNRYYYLSSKGDGILWVGFYYAMPAQHCLWVADASNVISAQSKQLRILQAWNLRGKLCAATGDLSAVYLILCGTNYLFHARVTIGSSIAPLAGSVQPGFLDSSFQASLFRMPSSMVLYDGRLYVADTGNCVIRELDLSRDTVNTVAGTPALCQRTDGQKSALANPTNLTYTFYEGFFIFTDKYANEEYATIRQFHVPTCTIQTVQIMPTKYYNEIMSVAESVLVRSEEKFQLLSANSSPCPAGTSSLTGGALSSRDCIACDIDLYSDVVSGSCKNCSTFACELPGQLLVPCQADRDAFCGACTNKPSGNTQYVGPSSVAGTALGGGDCPWTYTPPCPVGYYASEGLCSSCPPWSTTASAGGTSLSQCQCMGYGIWKDSVCVVPGTSLQLFPVLTSCPDYAVDSPSAICPCEPGEYIQQINPKLCTPCQDGYYSPSGTQCLPCPHRTESSLDKTTCRCVSGLRDASVVTQSAPTCVCGPGKSFSADSLQCTACEANTYNSAVIGPDSDVLLSRCLLCEGGKFSGSGASGCAQCPFGTYRVGTSPLGCQSCPVGMYAADARYDACTSCSDACNDGMKESPCPTDPSRFICSACQQADVRENAYLNGNRDCATSCQDGFFERDGECRQCQTFNKQSCGSGSLHVLCSAYLDAACVPCVNVSMPLNYAVWRYAPRVPAGPNAFCEWECEVGYTARQLPVDASRSTWECVLAEAWSVWDLFTI